MRIYAGDITPHKFKVWYGVYFLVGCVVFTYVLGEIVGIIVEILRWRRLMHVFDGGLSPELIERMDYFHDGQVRLSFRFSGDLVQN